MSVNMPEDPYEFGNEGAADVMNPNPVVKSILDFDPMALEQVALFLEQRGLNIPVNQLTGYGSLQNSTSILTLVGSGGTTQISIDSTGQALVFSSKPSCADIVTYFTTCADLVDTVTDCKALTTYGT